jgi:thiosulfate reductase cytochrome b subunit
VKQSRNIGTAPFGRLSAVDCRNEQDRGAKIQYRPLIHPVWVRVTHWINALAMLMMIRSGWQIYNASPLFGFTFPTQIALGNCLAGALLRHFAAMWLLGINGVVYVALGILTGRFRRKLFPISPREV